MHDAHAVIVFAEIPPSASSTTSAYEHFHGKVTSYSCGSIPIEWYTYDYIDIILNGIPMTNGTYHSPPVQPSVILSQEANAGKLDYERQVPSKNSSWRCLCANWKLKVLPQNL